MDKVVIEDYYHTTIVDENMKHMKLTHLLSSFPLKLKAACCTYNFISFFLKALLDVHTRKNIITLLDVYYVH
jgi:hypothetical protein